MSRNDQKDRYDEVEEIVRTRIVPDDAELMVNETEDFFLVKFDDGQIYGLIY